MNKLLKTALIATMTLAFNHAKSQAFYIFHNDDFILGYLVNGSKIEMTDFDGEDWGTWDVEFQWDNAMELGAPISMVINDKFILEPIQEYNGIVEYKYTGLVDGGMTKDNVLVIDIRKAER